jgi:hypothetical protein
MIRSTIRQRTTSPTIQYPTSYLQDTILLDFRPSFTFIPPLLSKKISIPTSTDTLRHHGKILHIPHLHRCPSLSPNTLLGPYPPRLDQSRKAARTSPYRDRPHVAVTFASAVFAAIIQGHSHSLLRSLRSDHRFPQGRRNDLRLVNRDAVVLQATRNVL